MNEFKNQCVHALIGTYLSVIMFFLGFSLVGTVWMVLFMSIWIESIQYWFFDDRDLNLSDRVMDALSYPIAAGIMWHILDIIGG
jgi:uncharacterized metal-binding protein